MSAREPCSVVYVEGNPFLEDSPRLRAGRYRLLKDANRPIAVSVGDHTATTSSLTSDWAITWTPTVLADLIGKEQK